MLDSVPEEANPGEDNDFGLSSSRADTRLSLRLPSHQSRATMVRTPATRPMTVPDNDFPLMENDEEQVLITELKQNEYPEDEEEERQADVYIVDDEEEEEEEEPRTEREEDYDTDLEMDGKKLSIFLKLILRHIMNDLEMDC